MALIKCHECGKDVSDKAKKCPSCGAKVIKPIGNCKQCGTTVYKAGKCPKCGAKVSKPIGVGGWIVIGILILIIVPAFLNTSNSSSTSETTTSSSANDPQANQNFENAKAKIALAADNDLLRDISPTSKDGFMGPYIVIGPQWYSVDIATKKGFLNTCNTMFMAGRSGATTFNIYEYSEGRKIGTYEFGNLKLKD